jgi:hypothetical protein
MKEVTINLPDALYEFVTQWATITQKKPENVIVEALAIILKPTYTSPELETPLANLTDTEVLALCEMEMGIAQGQQLSQLLTKQGEGVISVQESREMLALTQLYQRLWMKQAEALAEAVQRGLREPLT